MRIAALVAWALILAGCASFGADAVKLMTPDELAVLDRLRSYSYRTTEADIVEDYGAPLKGGGSARPVWEFMRDGRTTRLQAYYLTGRLNKVHFLSLSPTWGYVIHYNADGTLTEMK